MKNYKTVLITGGAGFVGSNLGVALKKKYPQLRVIAADNLQRRGSELNVKRFGSLGIDFVRCDIRDPKDLKFKDKIDFLIECSAEPSVLSGYGGSPKDLIDTNLVGTVNCLELARTDKADVIFLSSSRVYPYEAINSLERNEEDTRLAWSKKQAIGVDFPLEGFRSMYGATKLCSERILTEYINMYGLKAVINRCGVIAGPWQFGKVDQGVFTLWMLAHYFKRELKYIGYGGKGKQVRDLLHIDDLFELVDLQFCDIDKANNKTYNVGGGKDISLSLLETTAICQKLTGNKINIQSELKTRPADLAIYITDNSKVTAELGWKPRLKPEQILEDIYRWIKDNDKDLKAL